MLAEREAGRNLGRRQRLRTRGDEWVLLIQLQTRLELGREGDSREERGKGRDNSGLCRARVLQALRPGMSRSWVGKRGADMLGGSTCKAGLACVKALRSGAPWKMARSPAVAELCGG